MSIALVQIKIKYIPMCAAGLISTAECSRKIGITDRSVRRLKARFNACGYAVFVHGNAGKKRAKKYDYEKIARDYQLFCGTPFGAFRDDCEYLLGYSPFLNLYFKVDFFLFLH